MKKMDRKPWNVKCEGISLGVGVVAGLLMLGLLRHDFVWGWVWALLGGVIVGAAVMLTLRWALCQGGSLLDGHEAVPAPAPTAMPKPAAAPVVPAAAPAAAPEAPAAATAPAKPAAAPTGLSAARGGKADDLKKIKGVGPKLEQVLHGMGYYHFDQIGAWTGAEVAWIDENLEGFRGRVTRDDWVAQAKLLAAGGETEFSARVDKGKVY